MCSADASGPPTPERTPRGGHSMAPAPVTLRRGREEGRLKWGDLLPQQQGTNSGPVAQNARWTVTPELHFRCVRRPPRPALRSGPASASPPAASMESPRLRDRSARLSTRGRRVPWASSLAAPPPPPPARPSWARTWPAASGAGPSRGPARRSAGPAQPAPPTGRASVSRPGSPPAWPLPSAHSDTSAANRNARPAAAGSRLDPGAS